MVAVAGQHLGIPLPRQDGVQDGQAGDAGEVREDVVELEVHLTQGVLHVLGMSGGILHQSVAVSEQGAHGAHRLRRAEGGVQEAHGVEVLEPLAVLNVALPPGDVLGHWRALTKQTANPRVSKIW